MWPKPLDRVAEAAAQMLVERLLRTRFVVERNRLVKNAEIAGFFQISGDGENQPVRVVIESAADIVISALRERLILVIRATGCKLGCGKVENAFARTSGNHLDESEQVLV